MARHPQYHLCHQEAPAAAAAPVLIITRTEGATPTGLTRTRPARVAAPISLHTITTIAQATATIIIRPHLDNLRPYLAAVYG